MAFSSSTVSIGASTKKSDYDRLLDNTQYNKGRLDTVYSGTNTFAGAKTFSGTVSIEGTLGVVGAATLSGTLSVADSATVTGALTITGASRVRVTKNDAQSIPNATATIVQYDDEVFDNLGEFATYEFTAKETGYYLVTASLQSAIVVLTVNQYWYISIYKNGAKYNSGFRDVADQSNNRARQSTITDIVYLTATQYIDIRVYHNQGAGLNTSADAIYNYFSVHRLS